MNLLHHTWLYKKAIPKRICDLIIKEGLENNLQTAETGFSINKKISPLLNKNKTYKKIRNSDVCFFLNTPWINRLIDPYIHNANQNAGWNFKLNTSEDFQFTKYGIKQHYDWHQDSFKQVYVQGHKYEGMTRKVSVSVVLTDQKEYVGGSLDIAYQNSHKSIKTLKFNNLEVGSILVFPSFLWHKVESIKKGNRYSLVGWYIGEALQ